MRDYTRSLDLRSARLSLGSDAGRAPLATGVGEAPGVVHDDEYADLVTLPAHTPTRVWMAFGGFAARATHELPERVELRLPEAETLTLSEPGGEPTWIGKPVTSSAGLSGLWAQSSADEAALGWLLLDQRFAAGPTVIGVHGGFGVRIPQFATPDGNSIVCCNVALGADLALPIYRDRLLILAPYAGVEAALLVGEHAHDVHRRNWIGPALGVNFAFGPLLPRHGPFPIDYPSSSLGAFNLRLALVQWFGDGRDFPSFGVVMAMSMAAGN